MKNSTTILSMVLVMIFLLSACNKVDHNPSNKNPLSSQPTDLIETSDVYTEYVIGSTVKFGSYDWTVLDIREGKALLLTEKIIALKYGNISNKAEDALNNLVKETMPFWKISDFEGYSAFNTKYDGIYEAYDEYASKYPEIDDDKMWYTSWEKCSLRKWLNTNMDFTTDEWNKIETTEVIDKTSLGSNTQDKVFLLDIDAVEKYFPRNESRGASCKVSDEEMLRFLQHSLLQGSLSGEISERALKSLDGGVFYWWVRGSSIGDVYLKPMSTDEYMRSIAPHPGKPLGIRPAIWVKY